MRASAARRSRGGENGLPASRIIFQGNAAADTTAAYIAALLTISKWEVDVGRGASYVRRKDHAPSVDGALTPK